MRMDSHVYRARWVWLVLLSLPLLAFATTAHGQATPSPTSPPSANIIPPSEGPITDPAKPDNANGPPFAQSRSASRSHQTRNLFRGDATGHPADRAVAGAGNSHHDDQLHADHHREVAASPGAGNATASPEPGAQRPGTVRDFWRVAANLAACHRDGASTLHERHTRPVHRPRPTPRCPSASS